MTNYLKILHNENALLMDRTFAKNSSIVGSREYNMLQDARKAYPEYEVRARRIKKNAEKKTYSGLTYAFMEDYILTHEPVETVAEVIDEYEELKLISKCHSKAFRYPVIKKWFLDRYPEIKYYGMPKEKVVVFETKKESA